MALFGRYFAIIALGNLAWEIAQLPLYTIWSSGTWRELVIAVVHCTLGDVLISAACLFLGLLVVGGGRLDRWSGRIAAVAIPLGVGYTVFSEWLNVAVRKSWAYAPAMPVLPVLGTGLAPLLQWLVVPALGFWLVACSANRQMVAKKKKHPSGKHLLCWIGLELTAALMFGSPHGAVAAATGWVGDDHAAARLITAVEATGSGPTVDAGLEIRLAPGWHAYWRSPGDAGIPPSIDWAGSGNLARTEIAWPAPARLSLQGFETAVYEHHVVLPITLTLARPGAPLKLHAAVSYAACAEVCVPYSATFDLALPAGMALPGPEAPLIADARAHVPDGLAAARLELLSATVTSTGPDTALIIRLRAADASFYAPDLFVGTRQGIAWPSGGEPHRMGRVARLTIPLREVEAASVVGKSLTLTLVDDAGPRSSPPRRWRVPRPMSPPTSAMATIDRRVRVSSDEGPASGVAANSAARASSTSVSVSDLPTTLAASTSRSGIVRRATRPHSVRFTAGRPGDPLASPRPTSPAHRTRHPRHAAG